jgi:transcriptional regulator of acetoin/glycerol metabolism
MIQVANRECEMTADKGYLSNLERNWERFISNKPLEDGDVRGVVLRSWQRCLVGGVDPYREAVTKDISDDILSKLRVRNELFLESLLGRIPKIWTELDRSKCAIAAADARGVLLTIDGNQDYVAQLCQDWSAPGFQWDEERNGTNAIGTALVLGHSVLVNSSEHFCQADHRLNCMADLIRDPFDGSVLGVLDITTDNPEAALNLKLLLQRVVAEVSDDIAKKVNAELTTIRETYSRAQALSESLIAFDRYGRVVAFQGISEGAGLSLGAQVAGLDVDQIRDRNLGRTAPWVRTSDIEWFRDGSGGLLHLEKVPRIRSLRGEVTLTPALAKLAASSPSLTPLLQRTQLYARRKMPILLQGQTGNGKDVIARAIHASMERPDAPFIAVNCGAFPRDLIASELFGFTEGAFTGARKGGASGRFEDANGGTIFLDEIGDMPLELQPYLLRVLEERVVSRLGESQERRIDVQVVAATNKPLKDAIADGRFRSDLYFRLNCGSIEIPSLRHRVADIKPLIDALLENILMPGEDIPIIQPAVMDAFHAYSWPGNVRELRNVLECLIATSPDGVLDLADLPEQLTENLKQQGSVPTSMSRLNLIERDAIISALERKQGDVLAAAADLGLSRATLYRRLNQYNIDKKTFGLNS